MHPSIPNSLFRTPSSNRPMVMSIRECPIVHSAPSVLLHIGFCTGIAGVHTVWHGCAHRASIPTLNLRQPTRQWSCTHSQNIPLFAPVSFRTRIQRPPIPLPFVVILHLSGRRQTRRGQRGESTTVWSPCHLDKSNTWTNPRFKFSMMFATSE